jgi:hypothetical protein
MSKAKLLAARELINEKKYHEARALLRGVDDPIAKKWLAKLDEIAPQRGRKLPLTLILGSIVVTLIVVAVIGFLLLSRSADLEGGSNVSSTGNVASNDALVGIWRNQDVYRATVTYRADGTGMTNGVDPFAYRIVERIGDIYLVERTDTGQILYGSTSIYAWRMVSEGVMIQEFSVPIDLLTPGMSLDEMREVSNELDIQLWGEVSDPVTWELVTRST